MKILNKIFLGIIITVGSAILIAGMSIEIKQHLKVNYDLPKQDSILKQKINTVKKQCDFNDSIITLKNITQNKFIFENRAMLHKQFINDSIINTQLNEISLTLKIVLKNNKKAAKELENLKNLFHNNYVELKN